MFNPAAFLKTNWWPSAVICIWAGWCLFDTFHIPIFNFTYDNYVLKRGTKDTKGTVKLINLKQTDNAMAKMKKTKKKTAHMTQHRKLKNKQHEPPKKLGGDPRFSGRVSISNYILDLLRFKFKLLLLKYSILLIIFYNWF